MNGRVVRGASAPPIQVPGYHPRPRYDLARTRRRIEEKRASRRSFALTLIPMVDLFAVLVITLLMNFTTEGEAYFRPRDMGLPRIATGQALRSRPLLSVIGGKVSLESAEETGIDGEDLRTPDLPLLRETLRRMKASIVATGAGAAEINVQADENAPLDDVKLVMRVLKEEGWTGLNFIVAPPDSP